MEIRQHFTEHPASVGETYGEHFKVAAGFAGSLAIAAVAAAVHAVVPSRCSATASRRILAMHDQMTSGARGTQLHESRDARADDPAVDHRADAAA
ncbi:MAG: DUF6356 family protein [Ilumatobacter sp.]|uniref:DUF6356 family protein n=1 Tax=Ilumatobacter sp. TaxID=1967498 RepID=UPI003297A4FE